MQTLFTIKKIPKINQIKKTNKQGNKKDRIRRAIFSMMDKD